MSQNQFEIQLSVAVPLFTAIIDQLSCTDERKLLLKQQLQDLCHALRCAPQECPPPAGFRVPEWARSNGPQPIPTKQFPSRRKQCKIFDGSLADKKRLDVLNQQDQLADQQSQNRDALFLGLSERQARINSGLFASWPGYTVKGVIRELELVTNDNSVVTILATITTHPYGAVQTADNELSLVLPFDQDNFYKLGVDKGDTVTVVQRPGQRAVIASKTPSARTYTLRTKCPVCRHNTTEIPQNNKPRCINPNCYAVLVNSLKRIGGKHGLVGMPFSIDQLRALARECLIQTPVDLFQRIDATFYETVRKVCPECQDIDPAGMVVGMSLCRQRLTLPRLIYCLNIPGVQQTTAEQLAREFGSLERLMKATEPELSNYQAAYAIRKFFQKPANRKMINQYIALGLNCPG